jgi:hypothetical protein
LPDDEIKVPPLSVQLQIAEAATELQEIAIREATLGRAAAKNSNDLGLLDADIDALVAMALKMDEKLAIAERHADFLRRTFEEFGPWVNQQVSQTLAADHFEANEIQQITETLKIEHKDFSTLGLSLADSVVQTVPRSRKELRDSAFDFKGKAVPAIDWHHVGCTMIDLTILGGLATCIPTEGAGCAVALAATVAHAGLCP